MRTPAETAERLRQIAEAMRMDLDWPSVAMTLDEAAAHLDPETHDSESGRMEA